MELLKTLLVCTLELLLVADEEITEERSAPEDGRREPEEIAEGTEAVVDEFGKEEGPEVVTAELDMAEETAMFEEAGGMITVSSGALSLSVSSEWEGAIGSSGSSRLPTSLSLSTIMRFPFPPEILPEKTLSFDSLLDNTELLFSESVSEEMVVPTAEEIFSPAGVLSTIGLQPIKVIIVPEMNKDVRVLVTPMRIEFLLKQK